MNTRESPRDAFKGPRIRPGVRLGPFAGGVPPTAATVFHASSCSHRPECPQPYQVVDRHREGEHPAEAAGRAHRPRPRGMTGRMGLRSLVDRATASISVRSVVRTRADWKDGLNELSGAPAHGLRGLAARGGPSAPARTVSRGCFDGVLVRRLCVVGCQPLQCDVDQACDGLCTFALKVCGEIACHDETLVVPVGQKTVVRLATALGEKPTKFVLRSLICPAPPRPRRPTRRPRAPRRFPRSVRPTPTARPATPAGSISAEPGSVSSTVRVYTAAASPARQSSRTGARAMTATPSWATRASTAPRIISANRTPSASDRSQGEGRRTSERERRACR